MLTSAEIVERDTSVQQLRDFIDSGAYRAGDRLPAERELTHRLGLSRSALRKGLDALEREGTIWRHVGKGTFVGNRGSDEYFPAVQRISQQLTPFQMMRARLSLEPALAREAAGNASDAVVKRLRTARDRAVNAENWDAYEAADDSFHYAVAEATGNVLLQSLFDHLNQVRRGVVWKQVVRTNVRPPRSHTSFQEHDRIVDAIEARNPADAHKAMRDHLLSVSSRLFGDE